MEIGDRVRLLHGKEEGIVRRIIDQKTVEGEIEDGFLITVLKNELVTISREESEQFRKESTQANAPDSREDEILSEEKSGILLAVEIINVDINLWLINHTPLTLLFTAHALSGGIYKGLSYGTLSKYTYSKIDCWNLKEQDRWPLLILDAISFQEKDKDPAVRISKRININKNHLLKKKSKAPLVNLEATLIDLAEEGRPVNPEDIKKAFFPEPVPGIYIKDAPVIERDEVVDLHIEALTDKNPKLPQEEMVKIQMDHFEKKLDEGLVRNLRSITFIHGIGSGILRHKIHKYLSQYPHIHYFEDAQKDKFGYGATKVFFK
jgi:hypothetical protein